MEQGHNGAGRDDLLRSVIKAGTTPIVTRAAAVQAPRTRGVRGDLYRTFGDSYMTAFELAVTPAILGLMGYGLDRWLGIVPVLTLVLALTAFLTLLLRTWSDYVEQMERLESAGPWANATKAAPGPTGPAVRTVSASATANEAPA